MDRLSRRLSTGRAIVEGAARLIDLGGVLAQRDLERRRRARGSISDALGRDWEAVGADLRRAMARFESDLDGDERARIRTHRPRAKAATRRRIPRIPAGT